MCPRCSFLCSFFYFPLFIWTLCSKLENNFSRSRIYIDMEAGRFDTHKIRSIQQKMNNILFKKINENTWKAFATVNFCMSFLWFWVYCTESGSSVRFFWLFLCMCLCKHIHKWIFLFSSMTTKARVWKWTELSWDETRWGKDQNLIH